MEDSVVNDILFKSEGEQDHDESRRNHGQSGGDHSWIGHGRGSSWMDEGAGMTISGGRATE